MSPSRTWAARAAAVGACILLPLFGATIAGRDLARVFQFPPPLAIPDGYPEFSWIAVTLVLAPFAALAAAWSRRRLTATAAPILRPTVRRTFPWWGGVAVIWTLAWWVLAWSRLEWFAAYQRYTFFPLWVGFIVVVNALVLWRRGTCTMLRLPVRWAGLFAASAAFWWLLEWLNRFTRNWHYLGVADFGPGAYAFHATLCFSTVLPAVAGVAELLDSSTGFSERCRRGPALRWFGRPATGLVLLATGTGALIGAGASPWLFYAALWCAPLALALGAMLRWRSGELPFAVARGDWRIVGAWAIAALICGFFWELWNVRSAAKWVYTVPYVDRWHVFEMPLLGYLGYLPFGLECYLVAAPVLGLEAGAPSASAAVVVPRGLRAPAPAAPLPRATLHP